MPVRTGRALKAESASDMKWPDESLLPGFRDTFVRYAQNMQKFSGELLGLIAEALNLPPDAFSRFFEPEGNQDRVKIVKYPVPEDKSSNQGVGPHYDGGFVTLVSSYATAVQITHVSHRPLVAASVATSRFASPELLRSVDRCATYPWHIRRKYW